MLGSWKRPNGQPAVRLYRSWIAGLGLLLLLLLALRVQNASRWSVVDARHLPAAEIDGIGRSIRAWYRSEAWNSALRYDLRSAYSWARRSGIVNLLKITTEEDSLVVAEVGWVRRGVTNMDLTIGVSKSEDRWVVIGSAW
jgi:hypothetical protein